MVKAIVTYGSCFVILSIHCFASEAKRTSGRPEGSGAIASVDGQPVTVEDLEQKRGADLFQAKQSYYQAQRKALEDLIDEELLKRQAQKEGVTVEALLDRNVKAAVAQDPGEDVLRVYYEGIDTAEPYEAVRGRMVAHLRERRLARAKAAYLRSLRANAKVDISLAPPRASIRVDNAPRQGNPNAPVVLVEYADYECPYCQQIYPDLRKLQGEYKDKIQFVFKDVPLPNHPNARKAAEASHCARSQGKYWEYHHLLFTTKRYDDAALKEAAGTLNLDEVRFAKCLDSGEQAHVVTAQLEEAQRLGIPGTPTFFVNGRSLSGALKYQALRDLIEDELGKVSSPKAVVEANKQ